MNVVDPENGKVDKNKGKKERIKMRDSKIEFSITNLFSFVTGCRRPPGTSS